MSQASSLSAHGSRGVFRPTWEIAASVGLHAAVVGAILLGSWMSPDPGPMIDPSKVMMINAVALPKSHSAMPDRPTRTPDQPRAEKAEKAAPAPPPGADAPTPPPTGSDMALKSKDAPPVKGSEAAQDHTKDRQAMLDAARKQALLKDMAAALGDEDRTRTDPNGVDPKDAIFGPEGGGAMDPELARYITACRDTILPNWTPLPANTPTARLMMSRRGASRGAAMTMPKL